MKNIKCCWAVEAATDDYILGCIRFSQRMKYLNSRYPTIILIPENISTDNIKQLQDNDCQYHIFKNSDNVLQLSLYTFAALEPLKLEEYDLVYNFEADMLPLVNLDHIIDLDLINADQHLFTLDGATGILALKPSIDLYNKIKNIFLEAGNKTILESFLYLDKYSLNNYTKDINYNYIIPLNFHVDFIHFPGIYKPWGEFTGEFQKIYCQANYNDFNNHIDTNINIWKLYSRLAEFLTIIGGDKSRSDFKDLIVLCLNHMKDIMEKY